MLFRSDANSTSSYVNTQVIGQYYDQAGYNNRQRLKNYEVFGNVEYDISDQLKLKGGIRYTEAKRSSVNKTFDLGNGSIQSLFTTVINTYSQIFHFGRPLPLVPVGALVSLTRKTGLPDTVREPGRSALRGGVLLSGNSWGVVVILYK